MNDKQVKSKSLFTDEQVLLIIKTRLEFNAKNHFKHYKRARAGDWLKIMETMIANDANMKMFTAAQVRNKYCLLLKTYKAQKRSGNCTNGLHYQLFKDFEQIYGDLNNEQAMPSSESAVNAYKDDATACNNQQYSDEIVHKILEVRLSMHEQFEENIKNIKKRNMLWQKVLDDVKAANANIDELHLNIKTLQKIYSQVLTRYKKIKTREACNECDLSDKDWPFYEQLESVLGNSFEISAIATKHSDGDSESNSDVAMDKPIRAAANATIVKDEININTEKLPEIKLETDNDQSYYYVHNNELGVPAFPLKAADVMKIIAKEAAIDRHKCEEIISIENHLLEIEAASIKELKTLRQLLEQNRNQNNLNQ